MASFFAHVPASAIATMGNKRVAKQRMKAAVISLIPGHEGSLQDLQTKAVVFREHFRFVKNALLEERKKVLELINGLPLSPANDKQALIQRKR